MDERCLIHTHDSLICVPHDSYVTHVMDETCGCCTKREVKWKCFAVSTLNQSYTHSKEPFIPTKEPWAIPSYQRRPSSLRKREGNLRFPTNLHGVRRSARPTSRWAPKAHHMMGKTHWRHYERSFGTNVLVLGKECDNFPLLSEPLKTDVNKNVVIERFLN